MTTRLDLTEAPVSTNELHLDDQTLELARQQASARNDSIESFVSEAIVRYAQSGRPAAGRTGVIGAMADYADMLDKAVDRAYRDREELPLRRAE